MMQSKLRKNTLQSLFDTHCEVVRTTAVADEFGTTSESQAIVAKYPCRITLYAEGGKGGGATDRRSNCRQNSLAHLSSSNCKNRCY